MVRVFISILICAWSTLSFAGYSYLGVSTEHLYYSEQYVIQGLAFRTSVSVDSPVLVSGGLHDINEKFSFSINVSSTLSPGDVEEKLLFDDQAIVDINGTDNVHVNKYSVAMAKTQTLLHYRLTPKFEILAGVGFDLHIFKRFGWSTQLQERSVVVDGVTVQSLVILTSDTEARLLELPTGAVEQTIFSMDGLLGVGYDSGNITDNDWRFYGTALVGKSLIRTIENTLYPDVQFEGTGGSRYSTNFGVSHKIFKGAHFGVEGYYSKISRSEESVQGVIAAKSETEIIRLTFSFMWKLD
ncbi:MAG: hypothetical protein JKY67_01500 [Pseudomonadales bacterium]|nr:hypothetical protein [Pseudomonadales bacterium]